MVPAPVRIDEMVVEPTCKYGHGKLLPVQAENTKATAGWGILRLAVFPMNPFPAHDGTVFTFALYRCPVCRYLEMFDLEK